MKPEIISHTESAPFEEAWSEAASKDHFWMQHRFEILMDLLEDHGFSGLGPLKVLDVGGGRGIVRDQVESYTEWTVDLCDLDQKSLESSKKARGRTLFYDIEDQNTEFLKSYDLVLALDVIEHLKDPREFLFAAVNHLKPGGSILVHVPATPWLFSRYDEATGHYRRYSQKELVETLESLPLKVLETRNWGISMIPVLAVRKLWFEVKNSKKDDLIKLGFKPPLKLINQAFKKTLEIEKNLIRNPFLGISIACLAQTQK